MTATMKVVAIRAFGGTENLVEESWPIPTPGPEAVRIRVFAASFNPIDTYWRQGRLSQQLPVVLGRDLAGVIDCTGAEVHDFRVGDEVIAYLGGLATNGSHAEYVCLPAAIVAHKPAVLSMSEAAALPVVGLTALKCVTKARVEKGEAVLVTGAAGGVGSMMVQLLLLAGASPVIGTAGSPRSMTALTDRLGLPQDWVVLYPGLDDSGLVAAVLNRNAGRSVGAAFDTVGGSMKRLCFAAVEVDGRVVSIVEEPADFPINLWDEAISPLVLKSLSFHFEQLGARALSGDRTKLPLYRRELQWLAEQINAQAIKPPSVRVMGSLSSGTAREAHRLLATGHSGDKLVMEITA